MGCLLEKAYLYIQGCETVRNPSHSIFYILFISVQPSSLVFQRQALHSDCCQYCTRSDRPQFGLVSRAGITGKNEHEE
jgi:hypothetical protein